MTKVVHLEEPEAICYVPLSSKQNRSLLPNHNCFHFIPAVFFSEIISLSYMSVKEKHPVLFFWQRRGFLSVCTPLRIFVPPPPVIGQPTNIRLKPALEGMGSLTEGQTD